MVTRADDRDVLTLGGRLHGAAVEYLDYSVEGAFQTGKQETGPTTKTDISAYMVGGEIGYTLGAETKPTRLGAGVDYLSGDANATDNKSESFNTLFGDNHKFYGCEPAPAVTARAACWTAR